MFDESIADRPRFTEPHQYPVGIPFVFVNGVAVVDEGKFTKALPGKVLSPAPTTGPAQRPARST